MDEQKVLSVGGEPVSLPSHGEEEMLEMPDGTFVSRDEFESAMNRGRRMAQQRRDNQFRAQKERKLFRAKNVTVRSREYRCWCGWIGMDRKVSYIGKRRDLCPKCGSPVKRVG